MIQAQGIVNNSAQGSVLLSKQEVTVTVVSGDVTTAITPVDVDQAILVYRSCYGATKTLYVNHIQLATIVDGKYTEVICTDEGAPTYNPKSMFDVIELSGLKSINYYDITSGSNAITAVNEDKSLILYQGGGEAGVGGSVGDLEFTSSTNIEADSMTGRVCVVEFY
ncbi:MAG: hypothetical protein P8P30_00185 [Rickettsiales bacterium]|nr:hypothetical protein [Rickettsiales bacterium]